MKPEENLLLQTMKKEQQAFLQFEKVLEDEYQALVSNSSDHLLAAVDRKAEQIEGLNLLALERMTLLQKLGVDANDPKKVTEWFNLRSSKDPLTAEWEKLLEQGRSAVNKNICNETLVGQRLEDTQSALHVLKKAAGTQDLYGRDGKLKNPFSVNKGY